MLPVQFSPIALNRTKPGHGRPMATGSARIRFSANHKAIPAKPILGFSLESNNAMLNRFLRATIPGNDFRISLVTNPEDYLELHNLTMRQDDNTPPYPVDFDREFLLLYRVKEWRGGAELRDRGIFFDKNTNTLKIVGERDTTQTLQSPFYKGVVISRQDVPVGRPKDQLKFQLIDL